MRSAKFLVVITLLVVVLGLTACNILSDVRSGTYENYEALVAAGEVERGWVPEFLPHSATDIRLRYDPDTNAVLLAFSFAAADLETLPQACVPIDVAVAPALSAEWWPGDLHADDGVSFFQCADDGYLAFGANRGYYWVGSKMVSVGDLHAHPKRYQYLDGQQVAVIGYVDFGNILDKRETYYDYETMGFVLKPGQIADAVFFANFDTFLDPHPLFDRLYCLLPDYESKGLQIVVTGTLHAFEMPTNFSTDLGYVVDVRSLDDVMVLAPGCETAAAAGQSIVAALPNAEYPIDVTASGRAQLVNGYFEEQAAPGSATKTRVSLAEKVAEGDLDGDGVPDAAMILIADAGGSGTFGYLAAVLNRDGVAQPVASILLGDRIAVKTLTIEDGSIVVILLARRPDEPLSARPNVKVVRTFRLQDTTLVEAQPGD